MSRDQVQDLYSQCSIVVWRVTPSFAEWISSRHNVLFKNDILNSSSTILELGCGVSGIVALTLGSHVGRYIATDQNYVLKLLKQNLANNATTSSNPDRSKSRRNRNTQKKTIKATCMAEPENIQVIALDWELDSLHTLPDLLKAGDRSFHVSDQHGVDAVIACDCIYNEALIDPLVQTCVNICRLRGGRLESKSTVCIVAQQLRSPEIFEAWLVAFHRGFHVWRVPENYLTESLKQNSGFAFHVGILRT